MWRIKTIDAQFGFLAHPQTIRDAQWHRNMFRGGVVPQELCRRCWCRSEPPPGFVPAHFWHIWCKSSSCAVPPDSHRRNTGRSRSHWTPNHRHTIMSIKDHYCAEWWMQNNEVLFTHTPPTWGYCSCADPRGQGGWPSRWTGPSLFLLWSTF